MANCSIRNLLSKIGFKLQALIFSILIVTIFLPLLTIIFTPIYLFRFVISKSSRYFRPDLGKILTARSTNVCLDNLGEPNPACAIVVVKIFKGTIPLQSLWKAFEERILPFKRHNGELRFPELKQYPIDWMGFKFWKHDGSFDIKEHVKAHDSTERTMGNELLKKLGQDALEKPFPANKSPWEMVLVTNFYPDNESTPHSVIITRMHHSVADGFALLKLLIEGLLGQPLPKLSKTGSKSKNVLKTFLLAISFPFRAIFECAETLLNSSRPSPLHVSVSERTSSVHAVTSKRISLDRVKKFKTEMDVSLSSLLLAAINGAIKATMMKKGMPIPQDICCILPFPTPGHPDKLRNHMTQVAINLPMKSASNSDDRLKILDKLYRNLSDSTVPVVNDFIGKSLGSLVIPLTRRLTKGIVPSILISNFPTNFNNMLFEGHPVTDCYFYCGLINMPGISFFIACFNECIRITGVAERSLMSAEDIQELVDHIDYELRSLMDHNEV